MQFKSKSSSRWWKEQLRDCDDHTARVIAYSERLANIIEAAVPEDRVDEFYEMATLMADAPEPKVITVIMYSYAIWGLARHWRFGDELKAWHNKRWSKDGLPFKVIDGIIMPCFIEDQETHQHGAIISAYCDFIKLDQRELKRLAAKTLLQIKFQPDNRA